MEKISDAKIRKTTKVKILGRNYNIEKHGKMYRCVKYNCNAGVEYSTRRECINNAELDVIAKIKENKIGDVEKRIKQAQVATHFKIINRVFENAIGFPIPYDSMLHVLCGRKVLDMVHLDKLIGTPENVSCKEFIKEKYGDYTLRVVEFCLKHL